MTMTLVSTVTVGAGGAATIDFTSIPQTATDLLLYITTRVTTYYDFTITFNGNSTGYTRIMLYNSSPSAGGNSGTTNTSFGANDTASETASTFSSNQIYIPNYTAAENKSFSIEGVNEVNAATNVLRLNSGLWSNTAAITSLSIGQQGGTFDQYSTASLYTITKGSGGANVA